MVLSRASNCLYLIILSFLFLSRNFLYASPSKDSISIKNAQQTIYINGSAHIYGVNDIAPAKVVRTESKDLRTNRKLSPHLDSTISNLVAKAYDSKKLKNKKPSKFINQSSSDDIGFMSSFSINKNTELNNFYAIKKTVKFQYTVLNFPTRIYLLYCYNSEATVTAQLSHFLFSRPPPKV